MNNKLVEISNDKLNNKCLQEKLVELKTRALEAL